MRLRTRAAHLSVAVLGLLLAAPPAWSAAPQSAEAEEIHLPPAVAAAVLKHRPRATIAKLTVEKLDGTKLYDIEFDEDEGEMEVAEDGTIIDISTVVGMEDLPPAAAEAIRKAAGDVEIIWLEKSEVRAEVQVVAGKARIVPLATFKYVYEAELVRGKQTGEVEVGADGEVIEEVKWEGESGGEEDEMDKPMQGEEVQ